MENTKSMLRRKYKNNGQRDTNNQYKDEIQVLIRDTKTRKQTQYLSNFNRSIAITRSIVKQSNYNIQREAPKRRVTCRPIQAEQTRRPWSINRIDTQTISLIDTQANAKTRSINWSRYRYSSNFLWSRYQYSSFFEDAIDRDINTQATTFVRSRSLLREEKQRQRMSRYLRRRGINFGSIATAISILNTKTRYEYCYTKYR